MPAQAFSLTTLFDARWQASPADVGPAWAQSWLTDQCSLTSRIQAICRRGFRVQVRHHGLRAVPDYAAPSLELKPTEPVLERQVWLCDGNTPLVFACSLLPECALMDDYAELKTLGSRPLGHWLFSEPVLQRAPMQYAAYSEQEIPAVSPDVGGPVAARKTLFLGAKKPFLVSEFFLPGLAAQLGEIAE